MSIVVLVLSVAIFSCLLAVLLKISQLTRRLRRESTGRKTITLYYVTIATGLCTKMRKFFYTHLSRMAFSKNKCEAAGGLAGTDKNYSPQLKVYAT